MGFSCCVVELFVHWLFVLYEMVWDGDCHLVGNKCIERILLWDSDLYCVGIRCCEWICMWDSDLHLVIVLLFVSAFV